MSVGRPIYAGLIAVIALASSCGSRSNPTETNPSATIDVLERGASTPDMSVAMRSEVGPVVDAATLQRLAMAQNRQRMVLPGKAMPYVEFTQTGGALNSDQSWGYSIGWQWFDNTPNPTTPDRTPVASNWGVNFNGPAEGDAHKAPPNMRKLWTIDGLTLSAIAGQPCPDRSADEYSLPESTVVISNVDGLIVADIGVTPGVQDCGVEGESLTPGQLMDILTSLVDCQFGAGMEMQCSALQSPTDDELAGAVKFFATPAD